MAVSVARVTTITSRSDESFEDAITSGISRASETLRNVSGAWVKDQKLECVDGQITQYHVVMEITFILDE